MSGSGHQARGKFVFVRCIGCNAEVKSPAPTDPRTTTLALCVTCSQKRSLTRERGSMIPDIPCPHGVTGFCGYCQQQFAR